MKKLLCFLISFALLMGVYSSCTQEELPGGIYGTVVDKATGEPIRSAGVELSPGGMKTVTGSEGQFEFTELAPGNYTLIITKAGYSDFASSIIEVKSAQTTKTDVQIEKLPPALTILDDDGNEVKEINFGENPSVVMYSFYIFNKSEERLEWSIIESSEWITSISKDKGELNPNATQPLVINIDRNKLNAGENVTTLHVISNNGTREISVYAHSNNLVETLQASDVRAGSAVLNGKITRDMSPSINKYGFVYSKKAAPTLQNGAKVVTFPNAPQIGAIYNSLVTDLDKESTYYARAYVSNGVDVVYGEQVSFVTIEGLPVVKTLGSSNITSSSALIQCEATSDAGEFISKRGVCYGKSPLPTIDGTHTSNGTGLGRWESSLTNLSPNVTYYVRAYATNSFGTSYGEQLTILTSEGLAVVKTGNVSSITSNSALCTGEVISDGDRQVIERGICWKKGAYPTINDSHLSKGAGVGSFSCSLTGLEPGVTYHVRAYATNSAGTVYGDDIAFMTKATLPTISTILVKNVTSTSAFVSASVLSTGGADITTIGFRYKSDVDYSFEDVRTQISNGSFSYQLNDLEPNMVYYIQAYAVNSEGMGLSELIKFTTQSGVPQVSTVSSSDVEAVSATVTGKILSDGGFPISECGICYSSTNKQPTINDDYVTNTTAKNGQYSCQLVDLEPSTRYYACAYAKNKNGIAYGTPINFKTTDGMPSISILKQPTYNGQDATLYGQINSTGGVDVVYYGVVLGITNTMPSIENRDAISYAEGNPISNTITFNIKNIPAGSMLYYRFFVVNSLAQVAYSSTGYITAF